MALNFTIALLSLQRALLDAITPQLRAVSIMQEDPSSCTAYFYYSGVPSDETIELWSSAITEASAGLGVDFNVFGNFLKIDSSNPVPIQGYYAYLKEGEVLDNHHIFPISLKELNTVTLRLATQNALLGKIPNVVRTIIIAILEGIPRIWVYLNNENENIDLLKSSLEALQHQLSEGAHLLIQYPCIPFPEKILLPTSEICWSVYSR